MQLRKTLALALALALFMTAIPAAAAPAAGQRQSFVNRLYTDLLWYDWAKSGIAWATARGLMRGDGQGRFYPGQATSRAEAIVVAVRGTGLEDKVAAASASAGSLAAGYFLDAAGIQAWAQPYAVVAAQQGILPTAQDGLFRPAEYATRLWVAVLLVKALGLEGTARAQAGATLTYKDANLVPRDLVGYVAAAAEAGIMRGYSDGTFQPGKPVTRAELAVLLSRIDQATGQRLGRQGELRGTLRSVDAARGEVTVRVGGSDRTLAVAEDAALFVDGREAGLADLKTGTDVAVYLNQAGRVLFLDTAAEAPAGSAVGDDGDVAIIAAVEETSYRSYAGQITFALYGSAGKLETYKTYYVDRGARIRDSRDDLDIRDLEAGDRVDFRLANGVVTEITVTGAAEKNEEELDGVITGLEESSGSKLATITIEDEDEDETTLAVAPEAVIEDEDGDEIDFADLEEDWEVSITYAFGLVTRIEVTSATGAFEAVVGEIENRATRKTLGELTLVLYDRDDELGEMETYDVDEDARLRRDGRKISLDDLEVGDKVEVELDGDVIINLEVVERASRNDEEISGTITDLERATRSSPAILSFKDSKRKKYELPVAPGAVIEDSDGNELEFEDLEEDDEIEVTVVLDSIITYIIVYR